MNLEFEKLNNGRWYIVLPDYPGAHADLEMVQGADKLLDQIDKKNKKWVGLSVEETPSNFDFKLVFMFKLLGGAIYRFHNPHGKNYTIWLCKVTKYVFDGELPKRLYCTII